MVDRNRPARYGKRGPMLLETAVPMMAYRLRPSRERLLGAARAILTQPDDLAERQLGAIYQHVKLDTQLPERPIHPTAYKRTGVLESSSTSGDALRSREWHYGRGGKA